MDSIVTLVNIDVYAKLLKLSGYNSQKSLELINGFKNGFNLGYRGPEERRDESNNLKLRVGNQTELCNKVIKEVKAKRFCGPFWCPLFDHFVQSPLGKKKNLKC